MNKERLGSGIIAVVVGLIVAFVIVPSESAAVPEGDYVLVEGVIDGAEVQPGLTIRVNSHGGVSGQTGGNTFYPDGFMTLASRIPPLPYNERHLIWTAQGDFVLEGDHVVFDSSWGRLVYERQ